MVHPSQSTIQRAVAQTEISSTGSLSRFLPIHLGEAEDQRCQLSEPEGRVLASPGASLRCIKNRLRTKGEEIWARARQDVTLCLFTIITLDESVRKGCFSFYCQESVQLRSELHLNQADGAQLSSLSSQSDEGLGHVFWYAGLLGLRLTGQPERPCWTSRDT